MLLLLLTAPLFAQAQTQSACQQSLALGSWLNQTLPLQTAPFTATYDATPGQASMDGSVGFSSGAATAYTGLAAITRFNPAGNIDVRNGPAYNADVAVPYVAGSAYHFRVTINPGAHTYSVYVTPPGQAEIALASNYAFRSEQATESSFDNWAMETDAGSLSACNMAITAGTAAPSSVVSPSITTQPASQTILVGQTATFNVAATGTAPLTYQWQKNSVAISGATSSSYTTPAAAATDNGAKFTVVITNAGGSATSVSAVLTISTACQQSSGTNFSNFTLPKQTAAFTATFDATPSAAISDLVIGFTSNAASQYANLAAIARFNPSGFIDARNGPNYSSDAAIPYAAGVSYHFRLVIDPTTQAYNVYVTPPGGAELALATSYAFRSEEASLTSINDWAIDAAQGSASVCNMAIAPVGSGTGVTPPPAATSTPAPQISLSATPATLNLGSVTLGASNSAQVTVTNTGTANADISNVSVSGAGITVSGITTGQVIPAGQSATLTVVFTPESAGGLTGSVSIASNSENSPATIALTASALAVVVEHSATLAWTSGDPTTVSYNVYRSAVSGSGYAKELTGASALTYTDSSVQAGSTYFYVVTAVNAAGEESAYSNQVAAAIP